MSAAANTTGRLRQFVGADWDQYHHLIGEIIHGDGLVYRWLEPDTMAHPLERRKDRINIMVDAEHKILGYSVG